ncbi:hypothetical protein [Arenimonas oryziterrae]|uniref:Uncharacterized protein n=1 Tax=Arenimonas oryziterrae DSM 21050 = YC6267 TaxID=1121015 RepID=A0A091AQ30_9GAMM|nr:hypothetical protein [Arenimonas oryziterrae]KFN41262.1 hypothetical protein N789_05070 [Arenimonas oryziterrae DSM 21050 = YC6267]
MNTNATSRLVAVSYPSTAPTTPAQAQASRRYRERDFGIGYGASSGYASERRYANTGAAPLLRCK